MGQRAKKIFCISIRFKVFQVNWTTLFFWRDRVSCPRDYTDCDPCEALLCFMLFKTEGARHNNYVPRFDLKLSNFLFITPPRNRGGVIFSLQFVSVCVCVCVCLSVCCLCVRLNSCEQNSSQTNEPIWTRFSLNGCVEHWLKPYWNWLPWVKSQGHCDRKCI